MNYETFVGEVQHRLDLGTRGEAVRATRATLTTLGERLGAGEATDLAGPLPMEIDYYLEDAASGQQFSFDEFLERVAERSNVDQSTAAFQAQAIVDLLSEVEPGGQMRDVREQLPESYAPLFEFVEQAETPWEQAD